MSRLEMHSCRDRVIPAIASARPTQMPLCTSCLPGRIAATRPKCSPSRSSLRPMVIEFVTGVVVRFSYDGEGSGRCLMSGPWSASPGCKKDLFRSGSELWVAGKRRVTWGTHRSRFLSIVSKRYLMPPRRLTIRRTAPSTFHESSRAMNRRYVTWRAGDRLRDIGYSVIT
jgi:hypothetical protein